MGVVEDVAARLRTQIPSRTVYEYALPSDGTIPAAYLLVRSSVSREDAERMCDTTNVVDHTVRVLSIARNPDAHRAARTADAGATFARAALRDWRPSGGQWKLRFDVGSDPYRDDTTPETSFVVGLQYGLRATP